ncbi:MAG: hypothetical protein H6581_06700 [Bacteroidia bacterium]|nr:hypothetical protein [Bacteroidia bacterium]
MSISSQAQTNPLKLLPQAHAHNDYLHKRPLFDALDAGFCSIEVDVHLIQGELVVAHLHPPVPNLEKNIQNLYFKPLQELIQKNGGHVFAGSRQPLTLMVDFKTGGETYAVLLEKMKPYEEMFTHWENGIQIPGPVIINISGAEPPAAELANEYDRFVTLDGRPGDLGGEWGADLMPRISERYGSLFSWQGKGEVPEKDDLLLKEMAQKAETEGRQLRFWASPENEKVWKWLLSSGVQLISTDKLTNFRKFALKPD